MRFSTREDVSSVLAALTAVQDNILAAKAIAEEMDADCPLVRKHVKQIVRAGRSINALVLGTKEALVQWGAVLEQLPMIDLDLGKVPPFVREDPDDPGSMDLGLLP